MTHMVPIDKGAVLVSLVDRSTFLIQELHVTNAFDFLAITSFLRSVEVRAESLRACNSASLPDRLLDVHIDNWNLTLNCQCFKGWITEACETLGHNLYLAFLIILRRWTSNSSGLPCWSEHISISKFTGTVPICVSSQVLRIIDKVKCVCKATAFLQGTSLIDFSLRQNPLVSLIIHYKSLMNANIRASLDLINC